MSGRYDLAFVGGGLAASATLIALLGRLPARDRRWRIAVIDAGGWFGGGLTYSGPAAAATLLQNPVREMPACLGDWLARTPVGRVRAWAEDAGRGARAWINRDGAALARGETAGLFVPRALYGHVQEARFRAALADHSGVAEVDHLALPVHGLARAEDGGLRLDLGPDRQGLAAERVVLCTGLIPRAPVPGALGYLDRDPAAFVAALAEQAGSDGRGVAVLGANAAALDVLHILDLHADGLPAGLRVALYSRSGHLPPPEGAPVPPEARALLCEAPLPACGAGLVARVRRAAEICLAQGAAPATLGAEGGMAALIRGLDGLGRADRHRVIAAHGRALSLLSRRAVPAYAAAAARLRAAGRVVPERAGVRAVTPVAGGARLAFADGRPDRVHRRLIDCRGAGGLSDTPGPLLGALAGGALGVRANAAGSGLVADDHLEAAPGLHVLGDLLTGHDGAHGPVWHLQSAVRIERYAEVLAAALAARFAGAAASASR